MEKLANSKVEQLNFSIQINAPVEKVWRTMLNQDSYREWTSAFSEGSYFEGSWEQGDTIRFLSPSGDGMVATIAENRPLEYLSIKHIGLIAGGVEDRESEQVKAWTPAFENYTFKALGDVTEVRVDQDIAKEYEEMMLDSWPRALEKLKTLCENSQ